MKYEQREVPFSAWILRVARNAALDHLRARRDGALRGGPDERRRAVEDDARSTALRACARRSDALPDDQREVLVLRHIAGLIARVEIANRLGQDRELGTDSPPPRARGLARCPRRVGHGSRDGLTVSGTRRG